MNALTAETVTLREQAASLEVRESIFHPLKAVCVVTASCAWTEALNDASFSPWPL